MLRPGQACVLHRAYFVLSITVWLNHLMDILNSAIEETANDFLGKQNDQKQPRYLIKSWNVVIKEEIRRIT